MEKSEWRERGREGERCFLSSDSAVPNAHHVTLTSLTRHTTYTLTRTHTHSHALIHTHTLAAIVAVNGTIIWLSCSHRSIEAITYHCCAIFVNYDCYLLFNHSYLIFVRWITSIFLLCVHLFLWYKILNLQSFERPAPHTRFVLSRNSSSHEYFLFLVSSVIYFPLFFNIKSALCIQKVDSQLSGTWSSPLDTVRHR